MSGHGNPSTLVLGEGELRKAELQSKSDTDTKKLLEELKPVLIHDGHLTRCFGVVNFLVGLLVVIFGGAFSPS